MAKTTKYIAQSPIVRLNGKNYEAGDTVTGLTAEQEKRLVELNAVATEKESKVEATDNDGEKTGVATSGGTNEDSDGEDK